MCILHDYWGHWVHNESLSYIGLQLYKNIFGVSKGFTDSGIFIMSIYMKTCLSIYTYVYIKYDIETRRDRGMDIYINTSSHRWTIIFLSDVCI